MLRRTLGTTLLAGVFLVAGLAGLAAFWAAWPRTSSTSPLAALVALTWGCTYVVTAILTWRRSRFAAPIFCAAIGLLLFPAAFIVPGGQILLPSFAILVLVAFFGYRYLHGVREPVT
jgi:dolichyl-phosphate-mannose--protein O-mannosyl transferase